MSDRLISFAVFQATDHPAIPAKRLCLLPLPIANEPEPGMRTVFPIGAGADGTFNADTYRVPVTAILEVTGFVLIPAAKKRFKTELEAMLRDPGVHGAFKWIQDNHGDEVKALATEAFAGLKHLLPPDQRELIEAFMQG